MTSWQTLGFVLGAAFASGLNLYATIGVLGLLHRFEVVRLPGSLDVLAHPVVLGVALTLYVIEFVADKIPYVDNIWDVVHTFIRPPAAAVLAYTALGTGDVPDAVRLVAAMVAGTVALAAHGAKASTRTAVNASPEPASNTAVSLTEDGLAIFLVWMAVTHPLLTTVLVGVLLVVSVWLMVKILGSVGRALRRLFRPRPRPLAPSS